MKGFLSLCAFALLVFLLGGNYQIVPGHQLGEPFKTIFADWKKRQEAAPVILIRASGTRLVAKGGFPIDGFAKDRPPSPPKDISCHHSQLLLLDLKRGRYRHEAEEPMYDGATEKFWPKFYSRTFNGKTTCTYHPREKNTHPRSGVKEGDPEFVGTVKGYMGGTTFQIPHFPLFLGMGIVPTSMQYVSPVDLRPWPDPELLTIHGNAVHGQSHCVVLRTRVRDMGFFDEIWVDPARGSAIVRMLFYAHNIPNRQLDIEYKETAKGWFPASWSLRRTRQDTFTESEEMKVDEINFNPELNDDLFEPHPKPGQRIKELERPAPEPGKNPKTPYKLFEIKADGTRVLIDSWDGSRSPSKGGLLWPGATPAALGGHGSDRISYFLSVRRRG